MLTLIGIFIGCMIVLGIVYASYCYIYTEKNPLRIYKMRHTPSCSKCAHCTGIKGIYYTCDIIYDNDRDKIECMKPNNDDSVYACVVRGTKACKFVARSDEQTENFCDSKADN